jgi:UDP-2,4-diacetamido-2,4,6-trideoxy-beta-L-altropyranose hydrolase
MRIVVRADSSKKMGFGHITRALTLARALQDAGADVISVGKGMMEGIAISHSFRDLHVIELSPTQAASDIGNLLELNPDGVVVDGYHFSKDFFEQLDKAGIPYAVIDDNGETEALNPIAVHNQNPHASVDIYQGFRNKPLFFLGLKYALLRTEVRDLAKTFHDETGLIVVSLGGTDYGDLTGPIARALLKVGHRIAVNERFKDGFGFGHGDGGQPPGIEYFPSHLFLETLRSANLAVLGAGTSLWEANALGTPTIGVIVADNQIQPAKAGLSEGYVEAVVNAPDAPSRAHAALEVVAAVSRIRGQAVTQTSSRIRTDGAEKVARALLAEFAKHGNGSA